MIGYIIGCLQAIVNQYNLNSIRPSGQKNSTPLLKLQSFVGDADRWLARIVKPIVNTNLWIQTRSALMS
ncbi:MAG: hypothetical protein ACOYWZ_06150 [Bacillota bacterium]